MPTEASQTEVAAAATAWACLTPAAALAILETAPLVGLQALAAALPESAHAVLREAPRIRMLVANGPTAVAEAAADLLERAAHHRFEWRVSRRPVSNCNLAWPADVSAACDAFGKIMAARAAPIWLGPLHRVLGAA
eukprot:5215847-Prymnesium_polylepis.1